jgi:tetratricopeptide (TPR) repeat protein
MVDDLDAASRARALFDAHVAAHRAGDAAGAERALQALRHITRDDPSLLPILSRALTDAHCWAGHARAWGRVDQLLNELCDLATREEVTEPLRTNLAEALFNAHLFAKGQAEQQRLRLAELRLLADRDEATEPQRTWLAMALFNHVNFLLESDAGQAYGILVELRKIARRSDASEKQRTQLAMALNNVGRAAAERGDLAVAEEIAGELEHLKVGRGASPVAPPLAGKVEAFVAQFGDDVLARAAHTYVALQHLAHEGHFADALWLVSRVEDECGTSTDEELRGVVAASMQIRAFVHRQQGELDAALRVYDRLLTDFYAGTTPAIRLELVMALLFKGNVLSGTGQLHAALAAYGALLQRFGDTTEPPLRRHVATALVDRGAAFAELGQLREAFEDCITLERRFGDDTDPIVVRQLAVGLANQAKLLRAIGKPELAVGVCERLIARYSTHEDGVIKEMVRQGLELRAEVGSATLG